MSLEILVDTAVLACVATLPVIAVGTVTVTGTATKVFAGAKPVLLKADIEGAAGAADSAGYVTTPYTGGSGHFESFVITTGETTNFFDGSIGLHMVNAGGTCQFAVDTAGTWGGPIPPPLTDIILFYPATWTVNAGGQGSVVLKAAP